MDLSTGEDTAYEFAENPGLRGNRATAQPRWEDNGSAAALEVAFGIRLHPE